jgi:hypothetical protein
MSRKKKPHEVGKLVEGQWKRKVDPCGTLHGPMTLFVQTALGTAKREDGGGEYEIGCGGWAGPGPPVIRSKKTGQYFTLSLTDLVNLAIAAGIDEAKP